MRTSFLASLAATASAAVIGNGAEWAGTFATPAATYTWSAEKVSGAYADPTMNFVAIVATDTSLATLNTLGSQAETAFASCAASGVAVTTGQTITPSATTCYVMTFDQTSSSTTFVIDTSGGANVAFYGQHFPTEFEATRHYFFDASNTDIEPVFQLPYASTVVGNGAEWAGTFPTPLATYTWSAEKVSGAYADPTMNFVAIAAPDTTTVSLNELGLQAQAAFATCASAGTVVTTGQTITPAPGTCYVMTFDQSSDSTTFAIDTSSTPAMAFYGQHFPTEFESTRHYFYDASNNDVEPVFQLPSSTPAGGGGHSHGANQESCGCAQFEADHPFTINCTDTATIRQAAATLAACGGGTPSKAVCENAVATDPSCQIAFFIIQSHHDYCLHDTLLTSEEVLFHDWEASCLGCSINRQYQANLPNCIVPDCTSSGLAETGHFVLNTTCTANGGAGSCCATPVTQGAFQTVVAYHDLCAYDQVPYYIENDFHDFEHACEDYFCNAIGPDYDGKVCQAPPSPPKPPPPPVWPSSAGDDGMSSGAIAGVVIGCILGFLLLGFVVYLVTQERAGTPVFSSLNAPASSGTAYPDAMKASAQA